MVSSDNYGEGVVVFADIIGFKDKITTESNGKLECNEKFKKFSVTFAKTIESTLDVLKTTSPYWGGQVYAFSDCFLIYIPLNNNQTAEEEKNSIFLAIQDIAYIVYQLSGVGIFLRGGATVGCVYSTPSIAFGPGVVRAVSIESQISKYPRIVFDVHLIDYFKEMIKEGHAINYTKWLVYDQDDDLWFLNYLRSYVEIAKINLFDPTVLTRIKVTLKNQGATPLKTGFEANELGFSASRSIAPLEQEKFKTYKDLIENGLKNPNSNVRDKYQWLAEYHNWFYENYIPLISSNFIQGIGKSNRFKTYAEYVGNSKYKPVDQWI